jgi:serine/threonine protein kinase
MEGVPITAPVVNRYLQRLANRVLGEGASPGDKPYARYANRLVNIENDWICVAVNTLLAFSRPAVRRGRGRSRMTDTAPGGTQILPAGDRPRGLSPGSSLGPYEIVAPLAAGGMGQVYRARDPRLGREVAIKVVAPALAADAESRRRFEREARAAAALNHPNVLVIHDVGAGGEAPYLVTELLDGQTLREILNAGPLPVGRALDFAVQALRGLSAAHEKGIVHRDLKPANLFVTRDGTVKLLDFGLARPVHPSFDAAAAEAETMTELTTHGQLLGTAGYMAPEQVRGEPAGPRADVFAFGCVLYEMLTGERAFRGATAAETMAAILTEDPRAPAAVRPGLDESLLRVVEHCLRKQPQDRYANAREVLAALDPVRVETGPVGLSSVARRQARRWIPLAALGAAGLAGGWLWVEVRSRAPDAKPSSPETWQQITFFSDAAVSPALSRDGRMLAFLRGANTFFGPAEVYAKVLPDGEPTQLTHDGQRKMSPVFSPDGSEIAYTQRDDAGAWDTWVVPLLGGAPRAWLANASGLSWIAPDRVLFSEIATGIHMGLVASRADRAESRRVYLPPDSRGMAHRSSLAPDGKWVLAAEMETGEWLPCRLLPFDGSGPGRLVGPQGQCTHAAWSPDGRWMYFSSNAGGRFQLWRQRFPDGTPTPLTSGPLEVEGLAITLDGRYALTSIGGRHSSIVVVDGGKERPIGGEGYAFLDANSHFGFSRPFSPDGTRLFYQRRREASRATPGGGEYTGELWLADLATGQQEQLLPGLEVYGYDVAPDGSQVMAGVLTPEGRPEVWSVPLDRRRPPRRLDLGAAWSPWFGPSGEVFYRSESEGEDYVYVSSAEDETSRPVGDTAIQELVGVSPDGEWLLVLLPATEGRAFGDLAALPRRGGSPSFLCANCYLSWAPGGRYLAIFLYATDHRGMQDVRTVLVELPEGESLPAIPEGGVTRHEELLSLPGTLWVRDGRIYPGPQPGLYAYATETVQRNIFRIPLSGT